MRQSDGSGGFFDDLERPPDVGFGRMNVPDRDAKYVAPAYTGVGKIDLAAFPHPLQDSAIVGVEIGLAAAGRPVAKDNRREAHRRHALEFRIRVDPLGGEPCDADVLANERLQAFDAEVSDNEPELERSKTAAE